jgi:DNA-binding NarL/FixJ family response regulator
MPLTLLLQDPRRLVLEGTARLLEDGADAQVALAVTDPARLTEADLPHADVALVSLDTDERLLRRVVRNLRRQHRGIRIVGTYRRASCMPHADVVRALAAVVPQQEGTAAIVAAIRGDGRSTVPLRLPSRPHRVRQPRPPALTPREKDVLILLARGLSAQQASEQLQISRSTVENHKQRMYSKLGVQSQAHAVSTAMRSGFLAPMPEPVPEPLTG